MYNAVAMGKEGRRRLTTEAIIASAEAGLDDKELKKLEDMLVSTDISSTPGPTLILLAQLIVTTEASRVNRIGAFALTQGEVTESQLCKNLAQKHIDSLIQSLVEKKYGPLKEILRGRATDKMVQATHCQGDEQAKLQELSRKYDQLASSIPDTAL